MPKGLCANHVDGRLQPFYFSFKRWPSSAFLFFLQTGQFEGYVKLANVSIQIVQCQYCLHTLSCGSR